MTAAIVSIHVVTCLASLKMLYIKYFVAYGDWFWYPETFMQHLCISLYYLYILNNLPHLLWTETIQHISIDSQKQRSTVLGDDADQHFVCITCTGILHKQTTCSVDLTWSFYTKVEYSYWNIQQSSMFRMH